MEIRQVGPSGIDAAVALILEVFLQFDAPDDSEEGIRSFRAFVEEEEIRQTLLFFGAFEQGELKGVIVTDDAKDHICCFFVKAGNQRRGIGKNFGNMFWISVRKRYLPCTLLRMRFPFTINSNLSIRIRNSGGMD